jgi:uncharacterized repeat protein (TIGR01451 family)
MALILVFGTSGAAWATGGKPGTVDQRKADLTIQKSGTKSGNQVTFRVVMENLGPGVARNVRVIDTLPPQLTFVSVNSSGPAATCSHSGRRVTCTLANDLPVGQKLEVTIVTSIPSSARARTVVNHVRVRSDTRDPRGNNNHARATVQLR